MACSHREKCQNVDEQSGTSVYTRTIHGFEQCVDGFLHLSQLTQSAALQDVALGETLVLHEIARPEHLYDMVIVHERLFIGTDPNGALRGPEGKRNRLVGVADFCRPVVVMSYSRERRLQVCRMNAGECITGPAVQAQAIERGQVFVDGLANQRMRELVALGSFGVRL